MIIKITSNELSLDYRRMERKDKASVPNIKFRGMKACAQIAT